MSKDPMFYSSFVALFWYFMDELIETYDSYDLSSNYTFILATMQHDSPRIYIVRFWLSISVDYET